MFPPTIKSDAPEPLFANAPVSEAAPPSWIRPAPSLPPPAPAPAPEAPIPAAPATSIPAPPATGIDDAEAAAAEAALYAQATHSALPPLTPPAPSVDVREDRSAEVGALQEQLAAVLEAVESFQQRVLDASERDVVELALAIAERVVGRELATDPSLVTRWARAGIDALGEDEAVELIASPDVAASIEASGGVEDLRVVADPSLEPATCRVRGSQGEADVSRAARLAGIREALGAEED